MAIEKFEDLDFSQCKEIEDLYKVIQEKLGVSTSDMILKLSEYVKSHSEELALQLPNIAPYGSYEKMLEDNDSMSAFLRDEASKPENWKFEFVREKKDEARKILKFSFFCTAMENNKNPSPNDDVLIGMVFTNFSGKILHAFVQAVD